MSLRDEVTASVSGYLYHATYSRLLPSIKKLGLVPGKRKNWQDSKPYAIYLASDEYEAESYAEEAENVPDSWIDSIIVYRVSVKDLDKSKLKRDENVQDGTTTFEYHGEIPFNLLERVQLY